VAETVFNSSFHLVCLNAIVSVSSAIDLSVKIAFDYNLSIMTGDYSGLSTVAEVVRCPLHFYKNIKFLVSFSRCGCGDDDDGENFDNNHTLQSSKQDCLHTLNCVKSAFALIYKHKLNLTGMVEIDEDSDNSEIERDDSTSPLDVIQLYLGYLHGVGENSKARKLVVGLKKSIVQLEKFQKQGRSISTFQLMGLYKLVLNYYFRFNIQVNSNINLDLYLIHIVKKLMVSDQQKSIKTVFLAEILHTSNFIERSECINFIADCIEQSPMAVNNDQSDVLSKIKIWIMWKYMAKLFVGIPLEKPKSNYQFEYSSIIDDNLSENDVFLTKFRKERFWWKNSILSCSYCGILNNVSFDFDIEALLNYIREQQYDEEQDILSVDYSSFNSFGCLTTEFNVILHNLFSDEIIDDLVSSDDEFAAPKKKRDSSNTSSVSQSTERIDEIIDFAKAIHFTNISESIEKQIIYRIYNSTDMSEELQRQMLSDFSIDAQSADLTKLSRFISTYKNNNRSVPKVRTLILGDKLLDTLTCKIIISSHLFNQDSLFVCRAVQLIVQNAFLSNRKAQKCLKYLEKVGIDLMRASKMAAQYCIDGANTYSCSSTQSIPLLFSHQYKPI
jgi:hypothetical protein